MKKILFLILAGAGVGVFIVNNQDNPFVQKALAVSQQLTRLIKEPEARARTAVEVTNKAIKEESDQIQKTVQAQ